MYEAFYFNMLSAKCNTLKCMHVCMSLCMCMGGLLAKYEFMNSDTTFGPSSLDVDLCNRARTNAVAHTSINNTHGQLT